MRLDTRCLRSFGGNLGFQRRFLVLAVLFALSGGAAFGRFVGADALQAASIIRAMPSAVQKSDSWGLSGGSSRRRRDKRLAGQALNFDQGALRIERHVQLLLGHGRAFGLQLCPFR